MPTESGPLPSLCRDYPDYDIIREPPGVRGPRSPAVAHPQAR